MSGPRPEPPDSRIWLRQAALFLDIDGTLLDLAPTPEGVQVPSALPAALRALKLGLGGALALVSGRPLGDIDRLFPDRFDAAGTHGAEWRLGGSAQGTPLHTAAELALVAALLRDGLNRLPGVRLEHKPLALALHYRAAPRWEAETQALAAQAVQTLGPAYRLQAGKAVVEILPAEAGKGSAIQRFMKHPPYAGRTPIFVGDDLTDEDGFAAVNALGGLSIRVGTGAGSQACYGLPGPPELRDWLVQLVAALP